MAKVVEKQLGRPVQLLMDPVKGKLIGMDLCIPTIDVSAVDCTVELEKTGYLEVIDAEVERR